MTKKAREAELKKLAKGHPGFYRAVLSVMSEAATREFERLVPRKRRI
jgi:hypothetical protein